MSPGADDGVTHRVLWTQNVVPGLETVVRTVWTVLHSWGDVWRSWQLRAVSSPELQAESFIERDLDALEVHQNVLPKPLTTLTYPEPSGGIGSLMRCTPLCVGTAVGTLCPLLMIHTAYTCASADLLMLSFPSQLHYRCFSKGPGLLPLHGISSIKHEGCNLETKLWICSPLFPSELCLLLSFSSEEGEIHQRRTKERGVRKIRLFSPECRREEGLCDQSVKSTFWQISKNTKKWNRQFENFNELTLF